MDERQKHGALLIIGGHEDRDEAMEVLRRFVELSGGARSRIRVLTAASTAPDKAWAPYSQAFAALGVADCQPVHVDSRAEAGDPALAEALAGAGGIFIAGGKQQRLMAHIGGTAIETAIHAAHTRHGACLAGTSAGASAMSALMLAEGHAELLPEKGTVNLGAGFGMLQRVVIDQHFSERHRLGRLLTVVAQNPEVYGIGIDENTALQVMPGAGIEVLGDGAVTVLDGHAMVSNVASIPRRQTPEMIGVMLHLMPAGSRYSTDAAPHALQAFLQTLTARSATA